MEAARTRSHAIGFAVVDVPDEAAARLWAGKIAVACGGPQEVRRFRNRLRFDDTSTTSEQA